MLICAAFILVAKWSAFQAASSISRGDLQMREAVVSVSGAVKKPGDYRVLVGTPFSNVLKKAKPLPLANVGDFPGFVEGDIVLVLNEIQEIVVTVQGAVASPGGVKIPIGSRVCDLKSKIVLAEDADEGFFRGKRKLKNGEILTIPHKGLE